MGQPVGDPEEPRRASWGSRLREQLTLTRISVIVGIVASLASVAAIFGLVGGGEELRRLGTTRVYVIPETAPGARTTRTFRLRAGRYVVWCAVADHRSMGMKATLRSVRG